MVRYGERRPAEIRRFWSLDELLRRFDTLELLSVAATIQSLRLQFQRTRNSLGGGFAVDGGNTATVTVLLGRAHKVLSGVGFSESASQAHLTLQRLKREVSPDYSTICSALQVVEEAIIGDLSKKHFLQVPDDRLCLLKGGAGRGSATYAPLGGAVHRAFPSAAEDISEACYCLAVDANTAAVYHLMCAVEHALRALAKDRRVALKKGRPIDLAQWGRILEGLEDRAGEIEQWPASAAREQAREFYNLALKDCRSFNEAYRVHIAHARRQYDRNEAYTVYSHVEHFMQTLAEHISERKRTPLQWRRARRGRMKP